VFGRQLAACDRCIVGMIVQLAVYFGVDDQRIDAIVDNLLSEIMPDGGCSKSTLASCSSRWSKSAGRAAGIRYERCGCCAGGVNSALRAKGWELGIWEWRLEVRLLKPEGQSQKRLRASFILQGVRVITHHSAIGGDKA